MDLLIGQEHLFQSKKRKVSYEVLQKAIELDDIANSVDSGIIKISNSDNLIISYSNDGFYSLLGYSRKEFETKFENELVKVIYQQDLYYVLYSISNQKDKESIILEFRMKNKNSEFVWVLLKGHIIKSADGELGLLCVMVDITKMKQVQNELELKVQLDPLTKLYNKCVIKELIQNHIINKGSSYKHAFMILDIDNFKAINDNLGHLFGDSVISELANNIKNSVSKFDIIGRIGGDEFVIFLKDIESKESIIKKSNEICKSFKRAYVGKNVEYKISCSIGISIYPTDGITYEALFEKADRALYSVKNSQKGGSSLYNHNKEYMKSKIEVANKSIDIKNNIIKEKLKKEQYMARAIELNQGLYSYIVKPNTYELLYISANIGPIKPYAKVGEYCYKSMANRDSVCHNCPIMGLSKNNKSSTVELYIDKTNTWISATATNIILEDGKEAKLVCCSNVTNFIKRITSKDILTGLSSLSQFQVDVFAKINRNTEEKFALVYSDFNKFKYINGTAGYAMGNKVLVEFSQLILSFLEKNELVCRASSDKFLMLLKYKKIDELESRVNLFNLRVDELKNTQFSNIQISIISGVYLIENKDKDVAYIIDKANIARKIIKGSHKNNYKIYNEELHKQSTKEKEIESLMAGALSNDEFIVYLQPKFELKSGKIVGAEALVRWRYADNSIISPIEFIPIFEKNGFIIELDFYIYEEVFKVMKRWINNDKLVVPISVNVSRAHINDGQFIPRLKTLIEKYQIPIHLIELELTESIFLENIDHLLKTVGTLKEIGLTISIDDFGSGYSSLNLLKDLNADVLKLDKAFFSHDCMDKRDKVVTSNIIRMAKELDMKVLSEGVETLEQAEFLTEMGCDLVQGYLFAMPMPIVEFEFLLGH